MVETEAQVDKLLVYKSILELLQPGETVTKVTGMDVGWVPWLVRTSICWETLSNYLLIKICVVVWR